MQSKSDFQSLKGYLVNFKNRLDHCSDAFSYFLGPFAFTYWPCTLALVADVALDVTLAQVVAAVLGFH